MRPSRSSRRPHTTGSRAPGSQIQTYATSGSEVIVVARGCSYHVGEQGEFVAPLGTEALPGGHVLTEQRDADELGCLEHRPHGDAGFGVLDAIHRLAGDAQAIGQFARGPTAPDPSDADQRGEEIQRVERRSGQNSTSHGSDITLRRLLRVINNSFRRSTEVSRRLRRVMRDGLAGGASGTSAWCLWRLEAALRSCPHGSRRRGFRNPGLRTPRSGGVGLCNRWACCGDGAGPSGVDATRRRTIRAMAGRSHSRSWIRSWLIVLVAVLLAAGSALTMSLLSTARYRASAEVTVLVRVRSIESEALVATSQEVAVEVRQVVGDAPDLVVEVVDDDVLRFTAESTNAETAATAANLHADLYAAPRGDTVVVTERAATPSDPYEPQTVRNVLLAAAAGLLIGLVAALVLRRFDPTIRSARQLAAFTRVPNLGVIPSIRPVD